MNLDFPMLLVILVHFRKSNCMDDEQNEIAIPKIIRHPLSQIAEYNSSVSLLCETNIDRGVEISWLFEGRILKPSYDVEMQDNTLFLKRFGFSLSALPGKYTCIVNSPQGKIRSKPAHVSLPTIEESPSSKTNLTKTTVLLNVSSGNDVVIECTLPVGNPSSIPLFYTPKGTLVRSSAKYRILQSGHLQIVDVQFSDSGRYVCAGQNPVSKIIVNTTSVILTVRKARESLPLSVILEPPSASRFVTGQNASLECSVAGNPPPFIRWEKFERAISSKKGSTSHGILYINNLTSEDKGTYICKISRYENSSTDLVFTSLVDVEEPPSFDDSSLYKTVKVKAGQNLDLKCRPKGKPTPKIKWYFNSVPINVSEAFSIFEYSLYVPQVSHDEEGFYQCFAENPHGIEYLTFYVTVDSPLLLEKSRPFITMGPSNASVYEGDTIVLTCVTEFADSVRWLHDGLLIDPQRMLRYEITSVNGLNKLKILSARKSDTGLYACVVKNDKTEIQSSGYLKVYGEQDGIPSRRRKQNLIRLIDITEVPEEDGVLLKWEVPKGSSFIDYFKILYKADESNYFPLDQSLSSDVRSYIVSSLLPEKKYTFQVEAVSKHNRRYPSNAVNYSKSQRLFYEMHFKPLSPPTIVDVWEIPSESDGFSIGLKWMVNDTNEMIDGFFIYYRQASSASNGGNYSKISVPNAPRHNLHSFKLKNLDAFVRYEIRVCSYNKRWTSGFSNSVSISSSGLGNSDNNIVWMQDATQLHLDHVSNASRLGMDDFSSNVIYSATGIIVGALLIFFLALLFICTYKHYQQRRQMNAGKNSVCYCDSSSRHSSMAKYSGTNTFSRGLYMNGCSGCKFDNADACHAISFSLSPSNTSQQQQESNQKGFSENFYHTLNSIGTAKFCEHSNFPCHATRVTNVPSGICCGHHEILSVPSPKCVFGGQQMRPVMWTHSLKRHHHNAEHAHNRAAPLCQSSPTDYFEDQGSNGQASGGPLEKKCSQPSSGLGSTLDSDGCCPNCSQYSSYSPTNHVYNAVKDKPIAADEVQSRIDSADPLMPLLNTNVALG